MTVLTDDLLQSFLTENPAWSILNEAITREWTFTGFPEAIAFVNEVATMAESAEHHPDIDIRYNRVRLSLVTHDAGGITPRDTAFALHVSRLS